MTFKEIMAMPVSETDTRTVAQYFCETLNAERRDTPPSTHYCESNLLIFRVPDHDITEEELWGLLDFEQLQLGNPGTMESVKTYKQLLQYWMPA